MKHTPKLILTLLNAAVSWLFAASSSSPLPETASRPVPLTITNEMLVVTCDDAAGSFAVAEKPSGNGLHHKGNFLAGIRKRKVRS